MNIVVVGGGTGLYTLLTGLKNLDLNISAIVSTSDNGGSSGVLKDELGILPPGDIRRCLVALSDSELVLRDLFEHRFSKGGLKGHSFGNLLITALTEITGGFDKAILEASRILSIKGNVLPSTLDKGDLCALLENGKVMKNQVQVQTFKLTHNSSIKKLFIEPRAKAYKPSIRAIKQADLIVLGPGSLYTSVLPNLVVGGISKAINDSKAKKVFITNIMTEHGETNGFSASKQVSEVEKYLKGKLDYVIVNTSTAPKKLLKAYAEKYSEPIKPDIENINAKVIKGDFLRKKNLLRHDSSKLAKTIQKLLKNDIYFKGNNK